MILVGVQSAGSTIIVVGNDREFIMVDRRSCLNRSIFVINRDGRQFLAFGQNVGSQVGMRVVLGFVVIIDEFGCAGWYCDCAGTTFPECQVNDSFITLDFTIHNVGDLFDGISAGVKFGYFVNIAWQLRNCNRLRNHAGLVSDIRFIKYDGLVGSIFLILTFYAENKCRVAVGKVDIASIDCLGNGNAGCNFFVRSGQFLNRCAVVGIDAESDGLIREAISDRSFLFFEIVAAPRQVFDGQRAVSASCEITEILACSRIQRINSAFELVLFSLVIFRHDDTALLGGVDDCQLNVQIGRCDFDRTAFFVDFVVIRGIRFFQDVRTPFQAVDFSDAGFVRNSLSDFMIFLVIQGEFDIFDLIADIIVFYDCYGAFFAGVFGCDSNGMIAIFVQGGVVGLQCKREVFEFLITFGRAIFLQDIRAIGKIFDINAAIGVGDIQTVAETGTLINLVDQFQNGSI